ncbi:MAG: energy-coupling factor transporter transmembrane protein EcfT [Desulfobacteraceae bacterium]|nr:energy-coupling factor transporter transmembrane protein EcfT [Desulfobacteraceae bacterium]
MPEKRLAVMMSLLMRFLPLIHLQIREISDAQKARGIECRKNPIYRTVKFVIPLIRRTFEDADRLVIAMKARSFCEDRSEPELLWTRQDSITFAAVDRVQHHYRSGIND